MAGSLLSAKLKGYGPLAYRRTSSRDCRPMPAIGSKTCCLIADAAGLTQVGTERVPGHTFAQYLTPADLTIGLHLSISAWRPARTAAGDVEGSSSTVSLRNCAL